MVAATDVYASELLQQAGLLAADSAQPTRRWHGALARAAGDLVASGQTGSDLRLPITMALHGILADSVNEQQLAALVEYMLPLVEAGTDSADQAH